MRAGTTRGFAIAGARALVATAGQGLSFGLLAAGCFPYQATAAEVPTQLSALIRPNTAVEGSALETPAARFIAVTPVVVGPVPQRANFEHERPSHQARHVADWVVDSGDNRSLPFAIVDKTDAKVFVI